ncbi:MAG: MotA/TolQ/ExbB proton channel family protein [Nitrospirae bacterium]|nr:MotA/TolQ/ExbB proton channel family protein [Nitrospirota bacterium]
MHIESEILKLIFSAGIVAKVVLLILFIFSIVSWAVMFFKFFQFRRIEKDSREFMGTFSKIENIHQLYTLSKNKDNPLASLVKEGYARFYEIKKGQGGLLTDRPAFLNAIDRRLKSTSEDEISYYEEYLSFLATTGNVTPFIGLFGTVWGIIHAFQQIGLQGSANIAAVAPGIAEALIATGAGLATAIPAVIGYNYLLNRVRKMASQMDVFSGEIIAYAEADVWAGSGQAEEADEPSLARIQKGS